MYRVLVGQLTYSLTQRYLHWKLKHAVQWGFYFIFYKLNIMFIRPWCSESMLSICGEFELDCVYV